MIVPEPLLQRLAKLRTEFVDLAYELERQGRVDAADIAVAASTRIGEVCVELTPLAR